MQSLFTFGVNLTGKIDVNALKGDGDEGQTALHIASANGHLEMVRWLLAHGADVSIYDRDPFGSAAALHFAACGAHVEVIRAFLDAGAEQRERGPLGGAVEDRHIQAIMLLLDRGADVLARDEEMGDTVLHQAARSGHLDLIKLLLSRGADVDAVNSYNGSVLCCTVEWADVSTSQLLLDHHATIDSSISESGDGCSPVLSAAYYGKKDV
ncbi:MAG: hypothetical protein M1816_004610 [Peltula sp. TS41687]|nr:MAG: hypothetical protein M1816_004610 [Peltula sp. TS41687]